MKKVIGYSVFIVVYLASCSSHEERNTAIEETEKYLIETETNVTSTLAAPLTKEISFNAPDGLEVKGVCYEIDPMVPVILLCHQAGYNLHEYDEIAPKLNDLGFNCIAIDQRSGGSLAGFDNQTYLAAVEQGLSTRYINAEQDIIAGIEYAHNLYKRPVILWGSSYSSALALHIAADNNLLKAVISFSPGDYFGDNKPPLKTVIPKISIPYFITSSKNEANDIKGMLSNQNTNDNNHQQFIPKNKGKHGSKALWSDHKNNSEYWDAVKTFLNTLK